MGREPGPPGRPEDGDADVELGARGWRGSGHRPWRAPRQAVGEGRVQPVAQHPELQGVEQLVDRVAAPRTGARSRGSAPTACSGMSATRVVSWRLRSTLPRLARRLSPVFPLTSSARRTSLLQRAEVLDPLRGRLLPHPRDAREVVGRIAAQRREVGVLRGREAVLLQQGGRVVALHLRHAPGRVQHRDVVADQLEGVAVAADDQDVHAVAGGLGREGRDDVVRFVAGGGQVPDSERVEDLVDQADLAVEGVGRLLAARLVLVVLLVPERRLAAVERDRHVRRLLVAQHVDEHRGEAVDSVSRLPGRGREVLRRQRVPRPVRQRMPVEQQ